MSLFRLFLFFMVFISYSAIAENTTMSNFLVMTDIHLDTALKHKMQFKPRAANGRNDLDMETFEAMLQSTKQAIHEGLISKPKFILLLGDIVAHRRQHIISTEHTVFSRIKNTFPATPIVYVFGNNDSLATNYGPFSSAQTKTTLTSPYQIAIQTAGWKNGFLSTGTRCSKSNQYPCLLSENTQDGYYSLLIAPKLRLVALNSVLFSSNSRLSKEQRASQILWLKKQFTSARRLNDAILIVMHVPPGNDMFDNKSFWFVDSQKPLLNLINQNASSVIGLLAGHTHHEEIKVLKNKTGSIVSGVFITPALSTIYGNSPAIKTIYYGKRHHQWQLINYTTYGFIENKNGIVLKSLYHYNTHYCLDKNQTMLECLSQVSWNKMQAYYVAGNERLHYTNHYPENLLITPLCHKSSSSGLYGIKDRLLANL